MTVSSVIIRTNETEYCRYSVGMNVISVIVSVTGGTLTAGDIFDVAIKKQSAPGRQDPYRVVMSKTITATSQNVSSGSFNAVFTLGIDDLDSDGIARCISGMYDIAVNPSGNPLISWVSSAAFHVTLISTNEIRKQWCYGAALRANEIVAPRFQPKNISGVLITEVSSETVPGIKTLAYTITSGVKTISWDGGDPITIGLYKDTYLLMDEYDSQYILVTVDPSALPTSSVTEKILIAPGEMDDDLIRRRVQNSVNSIELTLGFALEPHLYTSLPLYQGQIQEHNKQMDHWDRIGRPVDYVVPIDGYQWPSFRLPYQWCIKMHNLYGYHSVDRIIEIEGDWWNSTIDRMSGFVTLVPALASFARWTVYTHPMLAPFFMHRNIPSFWQYNATFGLPDLQEEGRAAVREIIARTTAISVLIEAGRGYQGGIGSEMTSRDGLTNSRNYNPGGPYAPTIQQHQQWLQIEVPRIKAKLGGVQMGMIGAS